VPSYKDFGAIPLYEQMQLKSMMDEFGRETGYQFPISDTYLLEMANAGVLTQQDFGTWTTQHLSGYMAKGLANMPWAQYGLTKDSYQQLATTYSTEYKKVTGQDIPPSQLTKAFLSANLAGGGLLSGSQYSQQLMNDAAIQQQYGWVKYGLDFTAWTQQKLSLQGAFGRSIHDAEAATLLQYNKQAAGSNMSAIARAGGQQQPNAPPVGGSIAR
jgi:hypothetical protein